MINLLIVPPVCSEHGNAILIHPEPHSSDAIFRRRPEHRGSPPVYLRGSLDVRSGWRPDLVPAGSPFPSATAGL